MDPAESTRETHSVFLNSLFFGAKQRIKEINLDDRVLVKRFIEYPIMLDSEPAFAIPEA